MKLGLSGALSTAALCGLLTLATAPVSAQSVSITSPAPNTVVLPGSIVTINFTANGFVAGISSITITKEGNGSETLTYGAFPPTNSTSDTADYLIPAVTAGEPLTVTVTASGYADSPVNASINLIAGSSGPPPPANNNFANAITVTGASGAVTGTNVGANRETGEPFHAGDSGGKSVWWKWIPPGAGTATIDTQGSNFDTLLGVYTGAAVNSLTTRASDDQSGTGDTSLLSYTTTAFTTYYIAVDGWSNASGNITLNWSFVPFAAASPEWMLYE